MNTEQGWVITEENLPKGKVRVLGGTFSCSKTDAIKQFIEGSEMTWAQCRKKYGWNVRKAKLTVEIDK